MTSAVARWRKLPVAGRVVLAGVAVVVIANVAAAAADSALGGRKPGGAPSSSYATANEGLAAYAQLLDARGHRIERLRAALHDSALDNASTLVIADPPPLARDDQAAVNAFVASGGRLVTTGPGGASIVRPMVQSPPRWAPGGAATAISLVPVAETAGVGSVRAARAGQWRESGAGLPVLAGQGRTVAVVANVDRGRVVAIADPTLFMNARLSTADNAAFGLAVVGPARRAVVFAEGVHGYGQSAGLDAIPGRWRWALGVLALGVVALFWSEGRRFGPPELAERPLPPPRRGYVDALAVSLSRTRPHAAALDGVVDSARRALAQRCSLAPDAEDADIRKAALGAGLSAEEAAALVQPLSTDADVIAAGRAQAHLRGGS